MQRIINHLIQLQELTIARGQQEATQAGARLAQLDQSIAELSQSLPPVVAAQFERLQKKNLLAIVPVSLTVCSGCGMTLPVSLIQSVRARQQLQTCPACARILYYPEAPLRRPSRKKSRFEPPKVGIERFSAPELMIPSLATETREEAIAELCGCLAAGQFVENPERLAEEALRREAIVTTAVDHGLAFPHVRGVEGGGLTLALGLKPKGLRFDPTSRSLTRVIFFMVIPTAASAFYLKLLSGLAQAFSEEAARQKLLEAESPEKLWKALLRTTRTIIQ